jgi:hypothetical protein
MVYDGKRCMTSDEIRRMSRQCWLDVEEKSAMDTHFDMCRACSNAVLDFDPPRKVIVERRRRFLSWTYIAYEGNHPQGAMMGKTAFEAVGKLVWSSPASFGCKIHKQF